MTDAPPTPTTLDDPTTTDPGGRPRAALSVCFFGLGEAGSVLAADLSRAGASVSAYDPAPVGTPAGVERQVHPALAARSADVVLAATAGLEARLALLQAIDAITPGTVYADVSTAAPGVKLGLADEAVQRDIAFTDVALLAMVAGHGLATPALASGPGAARLAELLNPFGARIEPIGGLPGAASAKKLLRSVMMKGTAAVLLEAVRAGAAADDLDWLWANLVAELSGADETWMRRLVEGSRVHARRRLDEMEAAVAMVEGLGVEATMTRSTVASLLELLDGADLPDLPRPG
jgi:3-hydroxyisobutyrate dehydrogenase-like beta-hydroxyacid dehydrogenase